MCHVIVLNCVVDYWDKTLCLSKLTTICLLRTVSELEALLLRTHKFARSPHYYHELMETEITTFGWPLLVQGYQIAFILINR
jgi:hypothetical protein